MHLVRKQFIVYCRQPGIHVSYHTILHIYIYIAAVYYIITLLHDIGPGHTYRGGALQAAQKATRAVIHTLGDMFLFWLVCIFPLKTKNMTPIDTCANY